MAPDHQSLAASAVSSALLLGFAMSAEGSATVEEFGVSGTPNFTYIFGGSRRTVSVASGL